MIPDDFCNSSSYKKSWFLCALILISLLIQQRTYAQKYNFTHYDIENGLVQSQALTLYQDKFNYLWIGTLGGLSRFDSKEFSSITKSDGLSGNLVSAVLQTRDGSILVGNENGISRVKNSGIVKIPISPGTYRRRVRSLIEDGGGAVWGLLGARLFKVTGDKFEEKFITGKDEMVSALTMGTDGDLIAVVVDIGLFKFTNGRWVLNEKISADQKLFISQILPDNRIKNKFYLLSDHQVLVSTNGKLSTLDNPILKTNNSFYCMEQDAAGVLWVGTNNGAYYLRQKNPLHFTAQNGFTDSGVPDILKDSENNIWLSTDGAGIYKYDGDYYTSFDQINGNPSQVIMGITHDKNNVVWMGTFNNGLIKYDGENFESVKIPSDNPATNHINSIFCGQDNNLLIGTDNLGVWEYSKGSFKNIFRRGPATVVHSLLRDHNSTIWLATPKGCFYSDSENKLNRVEGIDFTASSLIEFGKDSIMLGNNRGVTLIRNKKYDPDFKIPALEHSTVLSLIRYKNLLLVGTSGDGLFVYDTKLKKLKNYTLKEGLYSNDVYSLIVGNDGYIWAGTGRGVNRFKLNDQTLAVSILKEPGTKALIECNQNSIMKVGNQIWVGTTKGVYIYKSSATSFPSKKPSINIKSVKIYNPKSGQSNFLQPALWDMWLPDNLRLKSSTNNGIAIAFQGIFFTNPKDLLYKYRLRGRDNEFGPAVKTDMVEYRSLQPGTYTFEVLAITGTGQSSDVKTFSFEIVPAFYQTLWFKLLMVLLLISSIIGFQYYWNSLKARKKEQFEQIKLEEQLKIRRQTAEDFHDDIGNKLTRISVLSDILATRIGEDQPEQRNLIKQIKENTGIVYNGTKDILWALDPQSDNLCEILNHIKDTGTELFESTEVNFTFYPFDEARYQKIKLPMEYSRNMSMIFKELLNNILKHAHAKHVAMSCYNEKNNVCIQLNDDGKGFEKEIPTKGRGLKNLQVRAGRINASLTIESFAFKGTKTILTLKDCNIS